ncbi:MAG: hypothetical protein ACKOBL_01335 [Chloroflexota bacterium]
MNKIRATFQKITFAENSAPIAFFVISFLGFGLLIPSLGFYMDDWHYVFYAKSLGIESLQAMLTYDSRPNAGWLYILGFRILGTSPLVWHVFTFALIVIATWTYWLFIRTLWKSQGYNAAYIAILFAVYPFFMLQSSPVGYTHLWVGLITYNVSLLLMVMAVEKPTPIKWVLTSIGMALVALHLFVSEYFAGLEVARGVVLWVLLNRIEPNLSRRLVRIFWNWLPYLVVLGGFFFWRVVIFQNPEGVTRNEPIILGMLATEPLKAISFLITAFITDSLSVLTIGWQKATNANLYKFDSPFAQFRLAVSALGFALSYFYFKKLTVISAEESDSIPWRKDSAILAIAALLTSGLPIWIIGRSIVESSNLISASRFGLPTVFGAALLTFLLVDHFVTDRNKKNLLFALLVGLALNFHLDNAKEYQYSWEKQERFAQQLLWRAPAIEPGTAILTDQEIVGVMGEYAVSFSINTTYQASGFGSNPPYWYFPFYYTNPNVNDLLQGVPLEYSKLTMQFNGNSKQILLVDFNPEMQRCLWILQPQDTNLRLVSDDMRKLAAGSDISLIKQTDIEPTLPQEIYGETNTQSWCYYFEKADLARQYGQWDEIVHLWNKAKAAGERPDNGFEYIPFIEGLGHTGEWEEVKEMTKFAKRVTSGLEPSLCSAMDRLAESAPASKERDNTIQGLKEDLDCSSYQ